MSKENDFDPNNQLRLQLFLLGYGYQDMEVNLIDCLENQSDLFSRSTVFTFAKDYDKCYGTDLVKKLTEWELK